jgi:hypothetical protein
MLKHHSVLLGVIALWVASLACEPVIAIGWPELLILLILILVLLGPLMFKVYRFLDKVQKVMKDEKKKEK